MTTSKALTITTFNPTEVSTYGNQILSIIVRHEEEKENAEKALRQAGDREKIIDFELARVALYLHTQEKIDLYAIYEQDRESSTKLYRTILVEMGVLERKINDETDKVEYSYTDKKIDSRFGFNTKMKEKDEVEYNKARSRHNALNMRLARVCKAAIALAEAHATVDNMQVTTDESGEIQAMITKGPAEVMGLSPKIQIHSKSVSPVEGATATPTISGLAKLADTMHKPVTKSREEIETTDRKKPQDHLAILNAALMCVKSLEGKADKTLLNLLQNLQDEIGKVLMDKV